MGVIEWLLLVGESCSGRYAAGDGGAGKLLVGATVCDLRREERTSVVNSRREGEIGAGGPGWTVDAHALIVAERRRAFSTILVAAFGGGGGWERNA